MAATIKGVHYQKSTMPILIFSRGYSKLIYSNSTVFKIHKRLLIELIKTK